ERDEGVRALVEKFLPKHRSWAVRVNSQRDYVCFDQIVEKMGAEGWLRNGPKLSGGYFGQDLRAVDVFIPDSYAHFNIVGSPPPRPEKSVNFIFEQAIYSSYNAPHRKPLFKCRAPGVAPGIYVDDILD